MANPQKLFKRSGVFLLALFTFTFPTFAAHDYDNALHLATKFFGAQRCGTSDSWLHGKCHGGDQNIGGADLLGGWHDCGDHVKFGSTNGFAAAMMLHAYISFKDDNSYPDKYTPTNDNFSTNSPNGLPDVLDEVKYYTDYVMKTLQGNRLYFQIGSANIDHLSCSEPVYQTNSEPDLGGVRESHWVDGGGASNLAGINAAVLAMMAIALKPYIEYSDYASQCLAKAKEFFKYGQADDSYWCQNSVDNFGNDDGTYSDSSWADDMALGAVSLYLATQNENYLIGGNIDGTDLDGFQYFAKHDNYCQWDLYRSWTPPTYDRVQPLANYLYAKATGDQAFINAVIYEVSGDPANSEDGGYMAEYNSTYKFAFYDGWGSLKYSAGAAYIAMLAYDLTEDASYKTFAQNNLDFILGTHPDMTVDAPSGFSFLVGYGTSGYPDGQVHHSAAAGLQSNGNFSQWHDDNYDNPHTLWGALVGGPTSATGGYYNDRDDPSWGTSVQVKSNEVCIYYNAPLVALLGGFDGAGGNLPPSDIKLSSSVISESAASGTVVGTFTTVDIDGGSHTYTLTAGSSNFTLSGAELKTAKTLSAGNYDITVETNDGSATLSKDFTIVVTGAEVGGNLLSDLGWFVVIDTFGTTLDTGSALLTNEQVSVKFTLAKEVEASEIYPYAELGTDLPDSGSLSNSSFIKISYKSENNFTLELPMPAINTDIASQYGAALPASSDWNEVTLDINDQVFTQESWSEGDVPFDKTKVTSVVFSAKYNDAAGSITIRSIEVDGFNQSPITFNSFKNNTSKEISIKSISLNSMNISVPSTDNYNIKLYSLNGQLIKNVSHRFNKGLNKINWDGASIGNQVMIIKISGNKKIFTDRLILK